MKQMTHEEFGARLAPALSLYLSASADRARAEAEIRTLLPYRGDDLLKSLSSPPYLCDECDAPVAFAGFDKQTLCGGCSAKVFHFKALGPSKSSPVRAINGEINDILVNESPSLAVNADDVQIRGDRSKRLQRLPHRLQIGEEGGQGVDGGDDEGGVGFLICIVNIASEDSTVAVVDVVLPGLLGSFRV